MVIEGAQIEHSIVLPEAELRFVGTRLESSIIGRGARGSCAASTFPDAIRVSTRRRRRSRAPLTHPFFNRET